MLLENDIVNTKLIRVTRPFRIQWDIWIMLLAVWNSLSIPFFVAFHPSEEKELYMWIINTVVDAFFITDLILNFFTTYIDKSTNAEIFDHKVIVKKYLKRDFWIDMVASIPTDIATRWLGEGIEGYEEIFQLADTLKLIRILRLRRIIRLMH